MNNNKLLLLIQDETFRFSPTACRVEGITLQAAKFLRWLFIEPDRTNAQIINTFGMSLAWTMLNAGYVSNPLGESENPHSNLWSVTDEGIQVLKRLTGEI